jgi:hypothetical protein
VVAHHPPVKKRKVEQKKERTEKERTEKERTDKATQTKGEQTKPKENRGEKITRTSRTNQVKAGKQDNTLHRQNSRKTPPQHASVPSSDPFQGFHFGFRGGQFLFVKIRVMHVFVR